MRKLLWLIIALAASSTAVLAARSLSEVLPFQKEENSRVRFLGNQELTDEAIREATAATLRDIESQGISPARADDIAYYVGAFYRRSGFSKVDTTYAIQGNRIVVRIKEGPRTLLSKVEFQGNPNIPDDRLYEYMIGGKAEEMGKRPEDYPLNENDLSSGVDRVRGLYVSEGYLNVAIEPPVVRRSADGRRASVTVQIAEGPRYTFGTLSFVGETIYPREKLIAAAGELGGTTGEAFSATRVTNMTRNLQSFYRANGYYLAEVAVKSQVKDAPRGGRVPVTFEIRPGALHYFDGVKVQDQTPRPRLRKGFLPQRFKRLTGQRYDPEKLDEIYRELLRTGLFNTLRVNPVAQPDRTVRLDLTVDEAKAREIGFTLGFSSYEGGTAGIRLGDRNFLGNGRPLTFSFDYGQRGLQGELLYVDPWFLESQYRLRARLYSVAREEIGYKKNSVGGRVDLQRRVMPHLELGAFIEQEAATIESVGIDPLLIGPLDYTLSSFGLTQTTDYRDSEVNPRRGWIFTSSYALGNIDNSTAYFRGTARFSYYQPIGKKMLLALGARAGLLNPQVEQIPIDVRFFNGGSTTVRSFAERELGPKDRFGNPIGGDFFSVFNAEFTFPITGGLAGATFIDAGNVTGIDDAGFSDMRYTIGLGLRYKLPIGPLRLDYGINPSPRADEDFGAFHFSFGFAF